MRYSSYNDVFTGLVHTTLLGGEFANCHGQGSTEEMAVMSLRLHVNVLRRKNNNNNKKSEKPNNDNEQVSRRSSLYKS